MHYSVFGWRNLPMMRALSSLPPVPVHLPSSRETHLWYVEPGEVRSPSLLKEYLELLSPCEREGVSRLNGEKLQKGAILARALVRTTLARYTHEKMCPRSMKFKKNRFGKPEIEWQNDERWVPPSLQFNVSHTSSLIACGVTVDAPIGIDVEEKQRKLRNNIMSFARRYFTPCEFNFLHVIQDPEIQRQEVIKLWTLKEAYVKALGRGFSAAPFKDFTIRFTTREDEESEIVIEALRDPENLTTNWQFTLLELESSHFAAVCVKDGDNENRPPGRISHPLKLKVWKTLPLVEDECVSGTDAVVSINGVSKHLKFSSESHH